MSETKFTPGPWVTKQAIAADNVGGFDWCVTQAGDSKIIAEVFQRVGGVQDFWDDRPVEANARLIAAAPELYEALEPVKRGAQEADYYCPDDVPEDHVVLISMTIGELRAARAALSKAAPGFAPQEKQQSESA